MNKKSKKKFKNKVNKRIKELIRIFLRYKELIKKRR